MGYNQPSLSYIGAHGYPCSTPTKFMNMISVDQLRERMLRGQSLYLVNVLPKKSFDKLHIQGSLHASQYDADFLERLESFVPDEESCVVVYCNSEGCNASNKAATQLTEGGYTDVSELQGGLAAWRAAQYPVEGV